jgi:adenine-specific DNA-methyltransferase
MIKEILNENENKTPNSKEIAVLKEHFPSCFNKDGSFDIERFKGFLSEEVSISDEGYELKFLGKNYARLLASLDTTTVVVPNEEHNSKEENKNSENIYISGDNLDGLKHLLKSYSGKIKCIYIDPPYNTGTDGFVYNDSFDFTVENLSEKLSISEEKAARILDLTKRGSASHSAWLMFMYSRLLLARDLLSEDGAIFISIDDNEQSNLKLLCDDVFGEDKFAAQLPRITKKSGKDHTNGIASNHDYVLVYNRGIFSGIFANIEDYIETDEYLKERGPYKLNQTLDYDSLWYNTAMDFPIEVEGLSLVPGGDLETHKKRHKGIHNAKDWVWRWSKEKFDFGYENGFVVIKEGKDRKRIYTKTYYGATIKKENGKYCVEKIDRDKKLSSLAFTENKYSNDNATKEIGKIFDKNTFESPKPTTLIKTIIDLLPDDAIILDFFSGSGTTADAVLKANKKGGNRKFIMVQLPEISKKNADNFKTIDEIGINRIQLVANNIRKENPGIEIDLGFKHYVLQEPSSKTLDKIIEFDTNENTLFADKTLLEEFGKPTILRTWMVNDGYGLTDEAIEIDLAGYKAYYMKNHLYLIDTEIPNEAIERLVVKYETEGSFNPENVVLFGYSFTWTEMEQIKTNLKRLKGTEKNLNINFDVRY